MTENTDGKTAESTNRDDAAGAGKTEAPKEVGGRKGPDPTRYGDWEKDGRCVDF